MRYTKISNCQILMVIDTDFYTATWEHLHTWWQALETIGRHRWSYPPCGGTKVTISRDQEETERYQISASKATEMK